MMRHDLIPEEVIVSKIYEIRGQKVMIDRDLAALYGVQTKRLNEAVKRNITRFPSDFMFQMNAEEYENWRSQIATSKSISKGLRYKPKCFTEQGITMLSCVLHSEEAIAVNIRIIRTFVKMRELILSNRELLIELDKIRKDITDHDKRIELIFNYLKQFLQDKKAGKRKVGFKIGSRS